MAWALVAGAAVAHARPPEALACAVMNAPHGLDARVADVIVSQDPERGRPVLDELRAVVDACGRDQFLDDKQRDAYFDYTLGRMGRDVLDARLGEQGIAAGLIDDALDIGPGKANNPAEKVTQGDLNRVSAALRDAGHDPAKVTPDGWRLVTAWISATANMFEALRRMD
ncbi:hypothetical protein OLX02_16550 [Novosphingobium sp. KCTC 2891]|uniref:hypothetical protein n=1 Tax=Novosphingobium sp. KCTC 2891 TaxID=2989730 RepID=UPI0022213F58|nr:hypothetical protein [Novosphingobium sp. KCTC 2891]MCW1384433.1 hypothetical protein [Novosphingobium sp. KCTC 2891]